MILSELIVLLSVPSAIYTSLTGSLDYNYGMLELQTIPILFADPHIRAVDVREDLDEIANLIEVCFAETMDEDGFAYLRQMRRSAQEARMLRWATGYGEDARLPITGLVWVDAGTIIGNLTLIPLIKQTQQVYLIANVAVLPQYRRQGIGRLLTQSALNYIRKQGTSAAWLQVREDNPAACQMYRDLGFVEKARRTTWHARTNKQKLSLPADYTLTSIQMSDWEEQYQQLRLHYPREVTWNLPVNLLEFKPTLLSPITRLINQDKQRGWALRYKNKYIAALNWESSRTWADNLWPACEERNIQLALTLLLGHSLSTLHRDRPQAVNFPAGKAVSTFTELGFVNHVTLVWMEAVLTPPTPINTII